ncbi:MAG: ATP-binding protein [Cytophagales bacterium]|nr:ATP-binding protein [Cytophagales bacterium]
MGTFYKLTLASIAILLRSSVAFAQHDFQIKKFGFGDGLSNNEVTAIIQDKKGFIWIGTRNGLNRFDGNEFKVYQENSRSGYKLSSSSVEDLFQDSKGNIWIGTKTGGVDIYDPNTEKIYPFARINCGTQLFKDRRIVQVIEDHNNQVWLISRNKGIYKVINDSTFEAHTIKATIGKVFIDNNNLFWLATESGLILYDTKNRTQKIIYANSAITNIEFDSGRGKIWIGSWGTGLLSLDLSQGYFAPPILEQHPFYTGNEPLHVYALMLQKNGDLWIGTWGNGLFILNKEGDLVSHFTKNYQDPNTLASDVILAIYEDRNGMVWVGTDRGGLHLFKPNENGFETLTYNFFDSNSLSSEYVSDVIKEKHYVLVGTYGSGLNKVSLENGMITNYDLPLGEHYSGDNDVHCLLKDRRGNLWAGDLNIGLFLFPGFNGNITSDYVLFNPGTKPSIGGLKVTALAEDVSGDIWIGTQRHGINKIDLDEKGNVVQILKDDFSLSPGLNKRVTCILENGEKHLWVGTYKGLLKYPKERIRDGTISVEKISDELILSAYSDRNGGVWIGTPNGLQHLSFSSDNREVSVKKYNTDDGLSHNYVTGVIASPDEKIIWAATSYGLNRFDTRHGAFKAFYKADGLAGNTFNPHGVYQAEDGQMFFCASGGITYFYSDSVEIKDDRSAFVITGMKINDDREVKIGEDYWGSVLLSKPLSETKEITLNHHINKITLSFSAFDYFHSSKAINYYKLEGYNDKWVPLSNRNYLSFSNLKKGDYKLIIRASGQDGSRSFHRTSLSITVLPAPWASTWAFGVYAILGLIISFGIYKMIASQSNLRNKLKIEKITREKEHELHQLKLRFFTNISHELRTPLTLIAGPVEELSMLEGADSTLKDKIRLMNRNVKRLLRLSDQLITFRKVEVERMTLNLSKNDIVTFCREIYHLFRLGSGDDKYRFHFNSQLQSLTAFFDLPMLETIIYNLISNAVKFSKKEGGDISISIKKDPSSGDHIIISIADTGIGISKDHLENIFTRFYQLESNVLNTGAGIGLSLVKRLVEMHRGTIHVKSEPGRGTRMSLVFPFLDETWYKSLARSDYQLLKGNVEWVPKHREEEIQDLLGGEAPVEYSLQLEGRESILIVDDNEDLRIYLDKIFAALYEVHHASNGIEALQLLSRQPVDMIITDIMMNEMDGVELCKKIKVNNSYSHIPIIILSAKVEMEDQLSGLKIGADDYVEKPFNPEMLKTKVRNLLDKKHEMRRYYRQEFLMETERGEIENLDEKFILDVKEIVENNIDDSDKIKLLIQEQIAMSKPTFYRKLKSLTGYSLSEFIRSIRVKKAAWLLESATSQNISQIAYSVGFNDLKYFRTCFEGEFHQTPSQYRKSHKKVISSDK